MGRTPLISFWSISYLHSFPEIIPPGCLSLCLSSPFLCPPKYTKASTSTLKTLAECTDNGNVLLDSFHAAFHVGAVAHVVVYGVIRRSAIPWGAIKMISLCRIQQRCSQCVLESS